MISNLPKWVSTDRFEIQARIPGNPSKDQLRLMLQSLLADRFKLAIHFETRELPVLALTCHQARQARPRSSSACGRPSLQCGRAPHGQLNSRYRHVPHATPSWRQTIRIIRFWRALAILRSRLMAAFLTNVGHPGRPVVDRTGLNGTIDFAWSTCQSPKTPNLTYPERHS